jgi:hypothetical protein
MYHEKNYIKNKFLNFYISHQNLHFILKILDIKKIHILPNNVLSILTILQIEVMKIFIKKLYNTLEFVLGQL